MAPSGFDVDGTQGMLAARPTLHRPTPPRWFLVDQDPADDDHHRRPFEAIFARVGTGRGAGGETMPGSFGVALSMGLAAMQLAGPGVTNNVAWAPSSTTTTSAAAWSQAASASPPAQDVGHAGGGGAGWAPAVAALGWDGAASAFPLGGGAGVDAGGMVVNAMPSAQLSSIGSTLDSRIGGPVEEIRAAVSEEGPALRTGVATNVTGTWSTVILDRSYDSMVVVATLHDPGDAPAAAVRVRNASGDRFEVQVARLDGSTAPVDGLDVHYLVVEEGVYKAAKHGVTMEAVKYKSTVTDRSSSWTGEQRTYANRYANPVVVGQVMTANDARWSTFWARGKTAAAPPNFATLTVGKHVGEDPSSARKAETIGYIVVEAGAGQIEGRGFAAAVGSRTIGGIDNSSPYSYALAGLSSAATAVLSPAGMAGPDGGIAVLYGATPVTAGQLRLAIGEDQLRDRERSHTNEHVAYLVFEEYGNTPPRAVDDGFTTTESSPLTISAPGVLANDSDPDGDALTAQLVAAPAHGSLTFHANGSFTYKPNAGFHGVDSFTYTATDGAHKSAAATVRLTVQQKSSARFVGDDASTAGNWKGNYGSAGYVIVNDATSLPSGTSVSPSNHQNWTWAASTTDGRGLQRATKGSAGRLAATWYGSSFTVDVDAGQGYLLSAYLVDWDSTSRAQRIEVVDASSGKILDTRELSSFHSGTYLSWDVEGHVQLRFTRLAGANAVLSGLFLDPIDSSLPPDSTNTPPVAFNDKFTTTESSPLTIPAPGVLANDSDPDGDALTAQLVAAPAHGSLTFHANGSFAYKPNAGFRGTDSFAYTATDGTAESEIATVTIVVDPSNKAEPDVEAINGQPPLPNLLSITPRIVVTRASGMEPFVVQVHAAATTANFSDGGAAFEALVGRPFDPFLDLNFAWNFGDPSGNETFTHPVTGKQVDASVAQTGPEGMYVYRQPGAYTITLSVSGWTGTEYVSAKTTTVSVEATQQIAVWGSPTGGTFTLTFAGRTTAPIAYNAKPDAVQAALEALPNIGPGQVQVFGYLAHTDRNPMLVYFTGTLAGQPVPQLTAKASFIGGTKPEVKVTQIATGESAKQVKALAWSGEDRYFDSKYNGSKGPSDGSINRPFTTFAQLSTWLTGGSNRRALLKRGSSWEFTDLIRIRGEKEGIRIQAYGEGAAPKLSSTSTALFWLEAMYGSRVADVVFDGLVLDGGENVVFSFNGAHGDPATTYGVNRHFYWLNTQFVGGSSHQAGLNAQFGIGLWNCHFDARGIASNQSGLLGGAQRFFSVVGGSFVGGGINPTFNHHIYPTVDSHSLFRWIDFGMSAARSYGINTNASKLHEGGVDQSYFLYDGLDLTGTFHGLDFSSNDNSAAGPYLNKIVVQNSAFHTSATGIWASNPAEIVVRDNVFYGMTGVAIHMGGNRAHLTFHGNRIWRPKHAGSDTLFLNMANGGYVHSNIIVSLAAPVAGEALPRLIEFASATLPKWSIDNNQYYAPNHLVKGELKPFRNSTTGQYLSFEEWQAAGLDPNGKYEDPRWRDPGNGDFGS